MDMYMHLMMENLKTNFAEIMADFYEKQVHEDDVDETLFFCSAATCKIVWDNNMRVTN